MRRLRSILCLLCLAALVPLLGQARRFLPQDNRALVEKKYAGWTGVLRLWVFPGWEAGGSLQAWLNRCIDIFERRHPGVYVQPQAVDAGAIAGFRDSGIRPPDMLLFPPGLLDGADGLLPLDAPALRPELAQTGLCGDAARAVPVAMGGYLWAWNAAQIDGVQDVWRDADAVSGDPAETDGPVAPVAPDGPVAPVVPVAPVAPVAPEDDDWHSWSAALLALCSGTFSGKAAPEAVPDRAVADGPGVDLGLPCGAPSPAPTAAPQRGDARPCELPEGFAFCEDAFRRFLDGEAAAVPVTQKEVRRLQALSDQGRGPDWRLGATGAVFTDQLLFLSVVDAPGAQAELCRAFAGHLLADECQGALARAGAFSVTGADSGYAAGDPLAQMDAALRGPGLCAAGAFGGGWREAAADAARRYAAGAVDAPSLWRALGAAIRRSGEPCG